MLMWHPTPDTRASRRIVIAHMPQMLAEIVRGILEAEPELDVEGPIAADADLFALLERSPAAAVVIGHEDSALPEVARTLLLSHPTLVIVAIRQDGERGWVHRLVPSCEPVDELSPRQLAATLLAHLRPPGGAPRAGGAKRS